MPETASRPSAIRERIVRQAVAEFSTRGLTEVKITEIARPLGLASQAVYRYFKNREELFAAAVELDYSELVTEVLQSVEGNPLPLLTGATWYAFTELMPNHPLIRRVLMTRDAQHIRGLHDVAATELFTARSVAELQAAQRAGVVRDDVDVQMITRSMTNVRLQLALPLLAEGKYLSPEWTEITAISIASYFYPVLDVATPEGAMEVERKFRELAQSMLTA